MVQAGVFSDMLARLAVGNVDVLAELVAALTEGVDGMDGTFGPVVTREYRHAGKVHPSEVVPNAYAYIKPGESIMLIGTRELTTGRTPYVITYTLGEVAEYDSYNMSFYGRILAIGEKTVTISKVEGEGKARLSIEDFSRRNCRFDLDKARARNVDVMMTC